MQSMDTFFAYCASFGAVWRRWCAQCITNVSVQAIPFEWLYLLENASEQDC